MKKMGRKHRPFFRICACDSRSPRDGKVLEELGTYDPMVGDADARVTLNDERVTYWLGVGAQPSANVRVFIKKYGPDGTHVAARQTARERLAMPKIVPPAPEPVYVPTPKGQEAPAAEPVAEQAPATEQAPEPAAGAPAEGAPAEGTAE
jgi:small subunit ribosomal protein S16